MVLRVLMNSDAAILEVHGLRAGYGSVTVLRDFDLSVPAGKVLAILGPNGAGKTTLLETIAGLLPRHAGSVRVDGELLPSGRPRAANTKGVVLVPGDRALFATLTVTENIRTATRKGGTSIDDALDLFPALTSRLKVRAGMLSGGEQQMLALARSVVQRPRVLLIDEMSMGLAPVIVENLLPIVRDIADQTGAVVVVVEQHVRLALEVADTALVLVHGETRLEGDASDLAVDSHRLEGAYLGTPGY